MTDITANDGTWTFLCVTWSSFDGLWAIYVNGQLIDHGERLSEGQEIARKIIIHDILKHFGTMCTVWKFDKFTAT